MDTFDKLNNVNDEKSFILFCKLLLEERLSDIELEKNNPSHNEYGSSLNWCNTTLEEFLESAIAWAEDSNFTESITNENLWKKFAMFLHAGKLYE